MALMQNLGRTSWQIKTVLRRWASVSCAPPAMRGVADARSRASAPLYLRQFSSAAGDSPSKLKRRNTTGQKGRKHTSKLSKDESQSEEELHTSDNTASSDTASDAKNVPRSSTPSWTIRNVVSRINESRDHGADADGSTLDVIDAEEGVSEAVRRIVQQKITGMLVTDEDNIAGILTERDFVVRLPSYSTLNEELGVEDIMSRDVICVDPSNSLVGTMASMVESYVRHVAVIDDNKMPKKKKEPVRMEAVHCLLSIKDLLRAYVDWIDETFGEDEGDGESSTSDGEIHVKDVSLRRLLEDKYKRVHIILNTREGDDVTVTQAVTEMATHGIGSILLLDEDGGLTGIFSERDYLSKVVHKGKEPASVLVQDVACREFPTLPQNATVEDCMRLMIDKGAHHVPILEDDRLVGLLSIMDVIRELSKNQLKHSNSFWLFKYFNRHSRTKT